MLEFKTNKPKIALLLNNQVEVTFTCDKSVLRRLEGLNDKELTVIIKEFRKKRTHSQNSYLWVLLNEIAIQVESSKEDIYKDYIKKYGMFEILPIKNEAVETFVKNWGKNGIGWFCEDLGESKISGYTRLIVYYGSSVYNSKEMKRVLDAVVNDCEEIGIPTMTLSEIMLLKNENDAL